MSVLDGVPTQFAAGDTWRWLKDFPDYPAPTWVVTWYFENADKSFNVAASASGSAQSATIAASTTADYKAGDYKWFARAVSAGISELIAGESGWLKVLADPATPGQRDWRSDAQKLLDAVTAALTGRASIDQLSMSIGGRSISRLSPVELYDWQQTLQRQVDAEKAGSSAGLGRDIRVRFT